MKLIETRCDRCSRTIHEGASVFKVTAGLLVSKLHEPLDYCPTCSSAFLGWLRPDPQPQPDVVQ
ncbi:MAG: hypothetical protein ABS79_03660 [Planctomycetes bacterium SCN 63-9]|nr:MAG: hypothetical protein ABS79_03660 [Planctomycetes bacterium SCN 63-9]